MCLYVLSRWSGGTVTVKGYASNAFTSGTTLVTISCNSIGTSFTGTNYTWFTISSPAAYSHYEVRGSLGHDHYTWPVILAST